MTKCKHCGRLLGTFEIVCCECGAGCNYDPENRCNDSENPNAGTGCIVAFLLIVIGISIVAITVMQN